MAPRRSFFELNLLADHFPPLHGVRALAIACVLQVHVSITLSYLGLMPKQAFFHASTNLWFGIDVFFILSGFLIGTMLLPGADGRRPSRPVRFYVRRAFRILPLYFVVLTALSRIFPLLPGQEESLVYEYVYLTNYHHFTVPPVMPWAWSLCVEEHFYLAAPILAAILARVRRPAWGVAALVALWLCGLAARYAMFASRASWTGEELASTLYVRTHTRFDVVLGGVLLAYLQRYYGARMREALKERGPRLWLGGLAAVCFVLLVGPLAGRHDVAVVFSWGTLTSIMYVALLVLALNTDGPVPRWLGSRWFLRFGTLGYGVYLVHPPVIGHIVVPVVRTLLVEAELPLGVAWTLGVAVLLLATTTIAYVLHLAVEKPFLWIRDRVAG
jgi:peptidoglycan/LPS O-acetylase OafA/YrhL